MELVPIKVKIGLRRNGHADHPNWSKMPMIGSDSDVRQYAPFGWVYDKSSGHAEERKEGSQWDSPVGMQWGCMLVTEAFADEAVATFPGIVTKISEVAFQVFHDKRAMAHMPAEIHNTQVLEGLKLEHDLKVISGADVTDVKARIAKALDPNDRTPGVRKNKAKLWADRKKDIGVAIKS